MRNGRDILQHIGGTPLVRLPRIARDLPVPVLVKCEPMIPGGSVKDRIAKARSSTTRKHAANSDRG